VSMDISEQDIKTMIELLTTDIAIYESEADFLCRSAKSISSEKAQALFCDIIEDMNTHIKKLNIRKQELTEMLKHLKNSKP